MNTNMRWSSRKVIKKNLTSLFIPEYNHTITGIFHTKCNHRPSGYSRLSQWKLSNYNNVKKLYLQCNVKYVQLIAFFVHALLMNMTVHITNITIKYIMSQGINNVTSMLCILMYIFVAVVFRKPHIVLLWRVVSVCCR